MAGLIQNVKLLLSGAGYRVGDASPGRSVPEITEPVIALSLEQLDTKKRMAIARVTIVSPLALGAVACQNEALKVCRLLREAGAACSLEPYKLDTKTEVFMLPVLATFYGDVLSSSWQVGEGSSIQFDTEILDRIVSFTAWRQTEETTDRIRNMLWQFRVEEQLDSIRQTAYPTEPFAMTVTHGDSEECYTGCLLTLHKQVLTDGGMVQIWEGTAQSKQVTQ